MQWIAPEFHHVKKDARWYITSIILTLIFVAISVWQENLLFIVFVVIAEAMLLFYGNKTPEDVTHEVTDTYIEVGGKEQYAYDDLIGFSLYNDPLIPAHHELVLRKKKGMSLFVTFLIPHDRVAEARDTLLNHLDELEYEESLITHLGKRIGL